MEIDLYYVYKKASVICVTLVGLRLTTALLSFILRYVGPFIRGEIDLKKEGEWCVVTGATDGIGKAFCYKAASQGVNIVLISRTEEKLKIVAEDIESIFKVQTRTVTVDFSKGEEIYPIIEKSLSDIEVGTLINNVGLSYPYPEYFLDVSNNLYTNLINTNIRSVTFMCKLVMPQMVARRRGTVINLSSTTCLIPSPMLSIYAASKAYIEKFSSDLSSEYRSSGLKISCLAPGYVATRMSGIRRPTLFAPAPVTYVRHAMRTIGLVEKTTGYLPHSIMVSIIRFLDFVWHDAAQLMIKKVMLSIREKAITREHPSTS